MSFNYVVLGAGRQGVALAYDLARSGEAARVMLAELEPDIARHGVERLETLLPKSSCQFLPVACDVSKHAEVAMTIVGADVVLSAVPYRFNAALTTAAIAAHASFCDLGGNTQVVKQQHAQHKRAVKVGVSVVPDCGLAPGLGNHLATHAMATIDEPRHIHVRCGGLPQSPVGPLGYKLVFNFDGLINEYSGFGEFLCNGEPVSVPALGDVEAIDFPPPLGRCEAAVTSGGTSTCAASFRGRLQTYDYKTVRYPGHFAIVRSLFELGCFAEHHEASDGTTLQPKRVMRTLMEERLAFPTIHDLVVLRCTAIGEHQGKPIERVYDVLDRHDDQTGFSAMERMTAFPAALVAHLQARKLVPPGARPLELVVPAERYFEELPRHDVHVHITENQGNGQA